MIALLIAIALLLVLRARLWRTGRCFSCRMLATTISSSLHVDAVVDEVAALPGEKTRCLLDPGAGRGSAHPRKLGEQIERVRELVLEHAGSARAPCS